MEIEIKEKVVQSESVLVKTDKLQLNFTKQGVISLSTENGRDNSKQYINSNFEFYDNDLGLISLSIDSKGDDQCKNHYEIVQAVRKLCSGAV